MLSTFDKYDKTQSFGKVQKNSVHGVQSHPPPLKAVIKGAFKRSYCCYGNL